MTQMINHKYLKQVLTLAFILPLATLASEKPANAGEVQTSEVCEGFAGQSPRDIDSKTGTNPSKFHLAPPASEMNLCDIHFHKNAEHKAKAFSILARNGDDSEGYKCALSQSLTVAEREEPEDEICDGLKPGDTIEVHWVHTSCDVSPGPKLDTCLSKACLNPDLRVETQVFTLVNDGDALDFDDLSYDGNQVNGFHQAKSIPNNTGVPVKYMGSTTGPKFNQQICSPLQVTWSVRPQCAKLDINSLGKWCEKENVFEEDHAHKVRKLVTDPRLLSPIN